METDTDEGYGFGRRCHVVVFFEDSSTGNWRDPQPKEYILKNRQIETGDLCTSGTSYRIVGHVDPELISIGSLAATDPGVAGQNKKQALSDCVLFRRRPRNTKDILWVSTTRFGAKLSGIGYVESTQTMCGAPPDLVQNVESKPYHDATALLQRRFDAL